MPRRFTPNEVNALIPRLQEYFDQLASLRARAPEVQRALTHLEHKRRSNGRDLATEIREAQQRLEALRGEMQSILEKIAALGGEVKDIEQGLVDFPTNRRGRTVYLCWKHGEDRVRYWHELSAGFAGRQPLDG
jgi:hypothetical protein